ncbi:MAG: hypothetical protein IAE78_11500 [Myxococcus sp.]|nr:hypothetical protein [Myxococcus sp.]
MPYLTSGLLAFKKPNAKLVLELGEWIREHSSPSVTYLVQLDGGRALAMAVEARVGEDRENGEVTHFVDKKVLGDFAKAFKRPFWGGFAEGGYSNSQLAIAVDARGKARWRSQWRFEFPVKVEARGLYPLATPDDNAALYAAERAKKGYGLIGKELNADFHQVLSIERGDPLMTVSFLELTEETTERALTKWLSRYVPVKGEPKQPDADQVFIVLEGKREHPQQDLAVLATMMAIACRHRELPLPKFSAFGNGERTTCAIKGPAAAVLSTILQRRPFLDFVGEKLEAPVRVVSLRKGKIVASNGRMNALVQVRGGAPLEVPESIEWMAFPELPADVFGALDRALHRWAKQQATQGGGPQVIMSTGFGLFG